MPQFVTIAIGVALIGSIVSACNPEMPHKGIAVIPGPRPKAITNITIPPGSSFNCPAFSGSAAATRGFLTCQYQGPGYTQMTFYVYVPNGYEPTRAYPLVLLLHGTGEVANPTKTLAENRANLLDQNYVSVWGPGYLAGGPSVQASWPCFVVVPQIVGSNRWVNVAPEVTSYKLAMQPTESLQMAINITEMLRQRYTTIDASRIYITGISMGGFGVWDAILRWPTLFAAAVPVSGAGDPGVAARIAHLPLWDFHGAADTRVPIAASQVMIQAVQAAGGHPCFTKFTGAGHVIWDMVYGLTENRSNPLYPWLFAQQKNGRVVAPACD